MFASTPDLVRLVAIPFFGYVAYRDVKTRRVSNRTWYPIAALAVLLLVVDAYTVFEAGNSFSAQFERRRFLVGVGISLLFVVPLVYGFWLIGGFGGADTKAFWVVALLFPVFPTYDLRTFGVDYLLPVIEPNIPAFSLTILSNTVLVGIAYPFVLAVRNAASGYLSPGMFVAKPVAVAEITDDYGTILSFPDRSLTDDISLGGLRSYFSWRGLDIDALRMYLQYRGLELAELRANPDQYRDPDSLPAEPNDPGDGSISEAAVTDGGEPVERETAAFDDPWGAEAFLDDIEGSAYGTTPEALREGLEMLVTEDRVWISPGIPFLVPLFFGLLVSLTAGDLLFVVLQAVGLA
ncbi:A24 family peptidase C-terminal domain-containing protein [Salinibaculum rarum]|uniref:A24 family peptidase C-terminal domain-containing protein n=1 Tax=Salinibaculum rarum TaxID=3058903 RepID=UPI00265F5AB8|nr:A24 family peptidase C-terminal domain-containing protein [Salinibaculum sp. KK48]